MTDQRRSQFLQMGFHFAHLLAYSQSLQDSSVSFSSQLLAEMVNSCTAIINLAIETADDRTRHLTDHIYHVVTFSALTLTTAVHLHEPKLRLLDYDVLELDQLVIRLLNWLDTIGLRCHIAHLLGKILLSQFKKLRSESQVNPIEGFIAMSHDVSSGDELLEMDFSNLFPHFLESQLLDVNDSALAWLG